MFAFHINYYDALIQWDLDVGLLHLFRPYSFIFQLTERCTVLLLFIQVFNGEWVRSHRCAGDECACVPRTVIADKWCPVQLRISFTYISHLSDWAHRTAHGIKIGKKELDECNIFIFFCQKRREKGLMRYHCETMCTLLPMAITLCSPKQIHLCQSLTDHINFGLNVRHRNRSPFFHFGSMLSQDTRTSNTCV